MLYVRIDAVSIVGPSTSTTSRLARQSTGKENAIFAEDALRSKRGRQIGREQPDSQQVDSSCRVRPQGLGMGGAHLEVCPALL